MNTRNLDALLDKCEQEHTTVFARAELTSLKREASRAEILETLLQRACEALREHRDETTLPYIEDVLKGKDVVSVC